MQYISIDFGTVDDDDLSDAAYRLLSRIRKDSHVRETDGHLNQRELAALAAYHGLGDAKLRKLVTELEDRGYVEKAGGDVHDLTYLQTMPSKAKRAAGRAKWAQQKVNQRKGAVSTGGQEDGQDAESGAESGVVNGKQVNGKPLEAPPSGGLSTLPNPYLPPSASNMPPLGSNGEVEETPTRGLIAAPSDPGLVEHDGARRAELVTQIAGYIRENRADMIPEHYHPLIPDAMEEVSKGEEWETL